MVPEGKYYFGMTRKQVCLQVHSKWQQFYHTFYFYTFNLHTCTSKIIAIFYQDLTSRFFKNNMASIQYRFMYSVCSTTGALKCIYIQLSLVCHVGFHIVYYRTTKKLILLQGIRFNYLFSFGSQAEEEMNCPGFSCSLTLTHQTEVRY